MTISDGLAVAAIALSFFTIFLGVLFYKWQTRQGKRIGMSVINTMDQVYRQTRRGHLAGSVQEEEEVQEEENGGEFGTLSVGSSPRLVDAGRRTTLRLDCYIEGMPSELVEVTCVVERPSGERDKVSKKLVVKGQSFALQIGYPSDDLQGSTSDPGRYHVRWDAVAYWLVEVEAGKQRRQDCWRGSVVDSFGVLP